MFKTFLLLIISFCLVFCHDHGHYRHDIKVLVIEISGAFENVYFARDVANVLSQEHSVSFVATEKVRGLSEKVWEKTLQVNNTSRDEKRPDILENCEAAQRLRKWILKQAFQVAIVTLFGQDACLLPLFGKANIPVIGAITK